MVDSHTSGLFSLSIGYPANISSFILCMIDEM